MKKICGFIIALYCTIFSIPVTGFAADTEMVSPIDVKADKTVAYENQEYIKIKKIVIEEKEKDSFKENQEFVFSVKNRLVPANVSAEFNMMFEQEDTVEISNDTLKVEYKVENGELIVIVKKSDPAKIESFEIPNITLKQNIERTALRTYALYVSTNSETEPVPVVNDFVEVDEYVEPVNREPLNIKIKLGDNRITVNGVEKSLRVPAYISKGGYTMLPIREVTEVVPTTKVSWNNENKTASILYASKYVSIEARANEMYINGEKNILKNKAEVVDGRMFVALRDLCCICDISNNEIYWDNATKTVILNTEVSK